MMLPGLMVILESLNVCETNSSVFEDFTPLYLIFERPTAYWIPTLYIIFHYVQLQIQAEIFN